MASSAHTRPLSEIEIRVKALESLLVEKGLVDPAAIDALIDTYEHKVGPRNGARVVARAWVDAPYKQRLLSDVVHIQLRMLVLRTFDLDAVLDMADLPIARAQLPVGNQLEILVHLPRVAGVRFFGVILQHRDRLFDSCARSPSGLDFGDGLSAHRSLSEGEHLRGADDNGRNRDRPDHDHDDGSPSSSNARG